MEIYWTSCYLTKMGWYQSILIINTSNVNNANMMFLHELTRSDKIYETDIQPIINCVADTKNKVNQKET